MSDVSSSRSYARAGEKRERKRGRETTRAYIYIYTHTHTERERCETPPPKAKSTKGLENDIVIKKARTNFIHVERCASTGPAGPARHAAKSRRKLSRAGHFLSRVVVDAAKRALDTHFTHTGGVLVVGVRSFVKVKNTIQKRERDKKKKKKKKKEDLCGGSFFCLFFCFFEIFFTHSSNNQNVKRDGRLLLYL